MTVHELCGSMGHPSNVIRPTRCLCGTKRYRVASMVRDLRDLFSLTMHLRKHGL
jgi:hypothetical protein